ncbi:MAG TPA: putative peptidoglycan glycosyltransferase FtsW [Phycisphaerae bacterium]|nr:putative peptidoglycan glycosyltransferase FtsW [Phycisphaerae bacterium]HNU44714.1 putative peptidoglycan glycosyltransferase FtsW [Phycisphaerae bacterium]
MTQLVRGGDRAMDADEDGAVVGAASGAASARSAAAAIGAGTSSPIMLIACALMAIGVVMVASTSASLDHSLFGPRWWLTPFGRQVIFALFGLGLMVATARLTPAVVSWRPTRRVLPFVVFALVAAVLVITLVPGIGHARHGSQRWLPVGPASWGFRFQPSELAKLALAGALAGWFGRRRHDPRGFWSGFVPGSLFIGASVALVGIEDFGTAALIGTVGAMMLLVAGCRWRYLAVLALLGMAGAIGLVKMAPYRVARLTAFANPEADPQGAAYHATQSLVTIASGGVAGMGLGAGVQKYGYVPESRTDFIYSVICEETGLVGALAVVGLYAALVYFGMRVVQHARSRFERLLAFGVTVTIGLQAAMHIAVVSAAAPTKGISLPLVSAGGSGVLTFAVAFGLLAGLAARARDPVVSTRTADD